MLVHDRYGLVLTVVAALGAVAAIVGIFRPRILPSVRLYLRVTIVVVAIQVAIGLILVATRRAASSSSSTGCMERQPWLTLPIAMVVGRRLGGREEQMWLAGGAVLTLLFAFRAIATG